MKKLSLFTIFICLFTSFIAYARCITITAPNSAILYIDDSTTVAQLFRECRNSGFCNSSQRLVLYLGNFEIIENSEASNHALWYFSNQVEYATISYYHHNNINNVNNYSYDYQTRPISIRAPNGMVTTFKANQTPASFFRACRNAGYYSSIAPMTLKFGNYEIKENTPCANKYFYEFNTDATYAYVMYWDNYYNLENSHTLEALGAVACGVGLVYFLTLMNN